ncbi:hypothetical protein [Paraburkholderia sp. J11-2]|uniref:hypothetical protein n=1 Tax=Paraburkholderia sp. J11-2 TaxID=2805431 RepID=UPI002AB5E892|nr:hypothetical protein [Paraburkholderia sp. J11-2]
MIFSTGALANASAYRWQGSRGSKLKDVFVGVFDEEEVRFCGDNPERFIVDFHCPKCALATGIGFERYEFHMAAYKYRPLCVWIANP